MLYEAHKGYIYQDVLGAYFIASELANGLLETQFIFDKKQSSNDKFDDIIIIREDKKLRKQIKYSHTDTSHKLTKSDIASKSAYDLALYDLYISWKEQSIETDEYRICLAWDKPDENDPIFDVLVEKESIEKTFNCTTVYGINCDKLWPENKEPLSSWRSLKSSVVSQNIRDSFKNFTDSLIIEVNFPKSSLLTFPLGDIEKLYFQKLDQIGIGIYPNDHLSIEDVAYKLAHFVMIKRAINSKSVFDTSVYESAKKIHLKLDYGSLEQNFEINDKYIIKTENAISKYGLDSFTKKIVILGEPGAGKSWFIKNLELELYKEYNIVKHYCYTTLYDEENQKKRILKDALFGSLIDQLLNNNKGLKDFKKQRYASNLEELNIIIEHIEKRTLIIIDGLDHVERVYQNYSGELLSNDLIFFDIIKEINIINPLVHLIVLSQPIDEILGHEDFTYIQLPKWKLNHIEDIISKYHISDIEIEGNIKLSNFIYDKCQGNALYAIYLINEIKNSDNLSYEILNSLPEYNYNLSKYYEFLLSKIDESAYVSNALTAASFTLTLSDIKEITGLGNIVEKSISILKPILSYTVAYEGFRIYHESFRRFILERLQNEGANITKLLYSPLVAWLQSKDFFNFRKSYKHLFQLLYNLNQYDDIQEFIAVDFITMSLFYGHSITSIENNILLQKKSLNNNIDFEKIVILAELSKVLTLLCDYLGSEYLEYIKAIEQLSGAPYLEELIYNEGDITLEKDLVSNLLIDRAYSGIEVDWEIIPEYESYSLLDIKTYTVKCLQRRNYDKLNETIKLFSEAENNSVETLNIIKSEIQNWNMQFNIHSWINNYNSVSKLLNYQLEPSKLSDIEIIAKINNAEEYLDFQSRVRLIEELIYRLLETVKNNEEQAVVQAIKYLQNKNWYNNWIIYLIKVAILAIKEEVRFEEIFDAFKYLIKDTDPFKGQVRACDLYEFRDYIFNSIQKGLVLCNNSQDLDKCLKLLEKVTETTTTLSRYPSGPLTEERYLQLLEKYMEPGNAIPIHLKNYNDLKYGRLYGEIAEVGFKLSILYYKDNQKEQARKQFLEAIRFLTAYGHRKDRTLSELLDSSYSFINSFKDEARGNSILQDLYILSMAVPLHTDGRSTSNYPIEWFDVYDSLYHLNALSFLATKTIENESYHFHQEKQLMNSLCKHSGEIESVLAFSLFRTFPKGNSERYLNASLELAKKKTELGKDIIKNWISTLLNKLSVGSYEQYSESIIKSMSDYLGYDTELYFKGQDKHNATKLPKEKKVPKTLEVLNKDYLSLQDLLKIIKNEDFDFTEIRKLKKYILKFEDNNDKRVAIKEIVLKFRYEKDKNILLELFDIGSNEWMIANMILLFNDTDGWYTPLVKDEYFFNIYSNHEELAIEMLYDESRYYINETSYTMGFTGHLIKLLSKANVSEELLRNVWNTAFKLIKYRIPTEYEYNFDKFDNNILKEMNQNELYLCILLARFKTLTIERTHSIIFGITFLIRSKPCLLRKPLIWFFENYNELLPLQICIVLQIMFEAEYKAYIDDNLKKAVRSIYPTDYYFTDYLIENILDLSTEIYREPPITFEYPSHENDKKVLMLIHKGYYYLFQRGMDIKGFWEEYSYRRDQNKDTIHDFGNDSTKSYIPNVISSDIAYSIIQRNHYNFLKRYALFRPNEFYEFNRFNLENICLNWGSLNKRDSGLPRPTEQQDNSEFIDKNYRSTWIRIAYREEELCDDGNKITVNQSLVFSNGVNSGEYFSKYKFDIRMYTNFMEKDWDDELEPVILDYNFDSLEGQPILYLTPYFCKKLEIETVQNIGDGLYGVNEKNEKVIIYNTWKSDHVYGTDVKDEVTKLNGCELLLRNDLYKKLYEKHDETFKMYRKTKVGK